MKRLKCAASVACANLARLEDDLRGLEEGGCEELHFAIMDGSFAPGFTFGPATVKAARACCGLPCTAHLMVRKPEKHIERFVEAGCGSVVVHVETCVHAHRTLAQIRDAGASPGIALNPATPLTKLDYLLELADRVLVMAVEPGAAGQRVVPSAFQRVKTLRENIDYRRLKTIIEVCGDITLENAAGLARMGADMVVLEEQALNGPCGEELGPVLRKFKTDLRAAMQTV